MIPSSTAGGSVTSPGEGDYRYGYGTDVNLVALAESHYHFVHWLGDVHDVNAASTTVAVTEDKTVQAVFALDQQHLTISSTSGGSVTEPNEGTLLVDYGMEVNLSVVPEAYHHFVGWSGEVADVNAVHTTVKVTQDMAVQAIFALDQCVVSLSSSAGGAFVDPGEGNHTYDYGSQIMLAAQSTDPLLDSILWDNEPNDSMRSVERPYKSFGFFVSVWLKSGMPMGIWLKSELELSAVRMYKQRFGWGALRYACVVVKWWFSLCG